MINPARHRAHVLQPAYPDLWRHLSEDIGPMSAFRVLRDEAVHALDAWVGGAPSQTPIKLRTVRFYDGAPRFELIEIPLDEDDPAGATEWVTVEMPAWAIQAEGTYDMRLIPEDAAGYELARKILAEEATT